MENMINEYLLMRLKHQTSDFIELAKTKAIEVVVQHDERLLITILTLFFACYLIVFFSGHLWKKRKNRKLKRVLTRSMSIGVLHGGELALQRLVDYHEAKANLRSLDSTEIELELDALLNEERPDFKKLQRCVAKMEMSGKESYALMKLEDTVTKAQSKGKPHEAYEFEMLLVETLIYQGEFSKALSYKCLKDEFITDARRPLYKAIIYLSLGYSTDEAKNYCEQFNQIRKGLKRSGKDAQLLEITTKFEKLVVIVEALKEDIKEAKRKAKKNK
ncbi:putative protein isoform X1 [Capsicum annuum]|uniref:uncharacterized protein LOC107861122 isoform X1 n=2 Tax=Capsicum annuum TaxID=4072 RepID=UPI001FB0570A|nr:uncharacterized protein LOC107861122 isoform X1 [Capsicum annuum]